MTAQQLTDQYLTDTRNRLALVATQAAALRGELGRDAQDVVLTQLASEYRAARAAGDLVEAARIKALVLTLVPME